jgi:glutaconate CoA-transferase, subunit A
VILSAEQIVSTDELRRDPGRTSIPHFAVDAVVHAPFGAYPGTVQGYYASDPAGVIEVMGAMYKGNFRNYLEKHIYSVSSHAEYLDKVVGAAKLAEMRRRETIREGYGI